MVMRTLAAFTGLFLTSVSAQAQSLVNVNELEAEHPIEILQTLNFFQTGAKDILAVGRNKEEEKYFSLFQVNDNGEFPKEPTVSFQAPETMIFYDYGAVDAVGKDNLLFMMSEGVHKYDPASGESVPLIKTSSIYRQSYSPIIQQIDFVRDVNGDGFADVIIPDFTGYKLYLNDGNSGFHDEVLLNMQVEMRLGNVFSRNNQSTAVPRYSQFPYYIFDANFDGKDDIAFQKDRSFIVFMQKAGGGFEQTPVSVEFDLPVIGNSYAEQVRSNDRYQDQSDLAATTIEDVLDVNGDGVVDIVTTTDIAKGVFNRRHQFKYYFGKNTDGLLSFASEPSTGFTMKGFTARTRQIDFTTDGMLDFVGGSVNLGIGKMIGIFLSGSTNVDVNFYKMNAAGKYPQKQTFKKKVSVDFNLSSGQSSVPVVEMADLNGDGAKDLVLSKDSEKLQFYLGTPDSKKMFAKRARELEILLPKNGEFLTVSDINADGNDDLMFHFDRLGADGQNNTNRVVVLLGQSS